MEQMTETIVITEDLLQDAKRGRCEAIMNELVIFTDGDLELEVPISPDKETVWLTQEQMSDLFDTARSSIAYHIGKIFSEEELDKTTSVEIFDRSEGNAHRPPW